MNARRRQLLAAGLLLPAQLLPGARAQLLEEADYRLVPRPGPAPTGPIEVVEFFYYGCRWCNEFEPYLGDWLAHLPADVRFRRTPALRSVKWITLTRLYFALEQLGELGRLHGKVFRAYHRDNINLESEAELFKWAALVGLERGRFEAAFRSDAVTGLVERAHDTTAALHIDSTPSMLVDGRYLTHSGMTGGVAELLPMVDQLVAMARQARRQQGLLESGTWTA